MSAPLRVDSLSCSVVHAIIGFYMQKTYISGETPGRQRSKLFCASIFYAKISSVIFRGMVNFCECNGILNRLPLVEFRLLTNYWLCPLAVLLELNRFRSRRVPFCYCTTLCLALILSGSSSSESKRRRSVKGVKP